MKWKKPSGLKIETNDMPATIEYCESLNWEKVEEKKLPETLSDEAANQLLIDEADGDSFVSNPSTSEAITQDIE